jgi:tyrosine-protein kinase Etk/Wzc
MTKSMNQTEVKQIEGKAQDSDELGFIDVLVILAKHKKVVLGLPIFVAVASTVAALMLPNVYQASAKLLPPQQPQSGAAAILSQLGGLAGAAAGVSGLKNPNDLYVGMLKSRTVADVLVAQFDLKKVYGTDSLEKARKMLVDRTVISTGKDGLITIDVEDESPKRVASMANAYVDQLKSLTRVLAVTEAAQRRVFYERQLEMAKNNLANAEANLKSTLETRGVISVDVDSRTILETVGRIRAQISVKEVQLRSMRSILTTNNPEYMRTEEELASLRAELTRLENGSGSNNGGTDRLARNKQAGLENIKVLRDVKYYQMLYELLAKQYEVARLDEANNPSIIQVLDSAVVPEKKAKPKRSLIVLFSTIFGFVLGAGAAFILEAKRKTMASPESASRWQELKNLLRLK